MTRKRILCVLLAAVSVAALLAGCAEDGADSNGGETPTPPPTATAAPKFAANTTMGAMVSAKKLTVGVKFDQPGFGLKDATTGKLDGFDIAIAREIGKALGLGENEIVFVETVSADRIPYLLEGKADIVVATMTVNAERRAQIDFSRPYYLAGQSILVKKTDTTITKVEDLNGRRVCSVQGSTSEQNIRIRAPQALLTSLNGYGACVTEMKEGRVDAVSTDDIILAAFAASDNTLKLVGGQFTQEPYGVGIKKGKDDLVQFIDGLIAEWFQDGTWDRIYNQYLGKVEGMPKAADARAKIPATVN